MLSLRQMLYGHHYLSNATATAEATSIRFNKRTRAHLPQPMGCERCYLLVDYLPGVPMLDHAALERPSFSACGEKIGPSTDLLARRVRCSANGARVWIGVGSIARIGALTP